MRTGEPYTRNTADRPGTGCDMVDGVFFAAFAAGAAERQLRH
jgi:hypothetical protein